MLPYSRVSLRDIVGRGPVPEDDVHGAGALDQDRSKRRPCFSSPATVASTRISALPPTQPALSTGPRLAADTQAALTVIGRRNSSQTPATSTYPTRA
jgi:hypothetical protein